MVRLEKPEEVYDVEEVLGRDAASVFPSMQAQLDPMEQLKAAIGAKRFVTETELEEIKAARGLNVDDGTAAADKPLAEVLAERKKAKQDAFDEQWRQMKTGKNRPLDADELEFYNSLAQQEAEQQRRIRQEEEAELAAFREAVAAAAAAKAAAAAAAAEAAGAAEGMLDEAAAAAAESQAGSKAGLGRTGSGSGAAKPAAGKVTAKAVLPVLKPIVKVRPKGAAAAGQDGSGSSSAGHAARKAAAEAAATAGGSSPSSKRQRLEGTAAAGQQQQQDDGAGLAGLLGGYGSGSDDPDD